LQHGGGGKKKGPPASLKRFTSPPGGGGGKHELFNTGLLGEKDTRKEGKSDAQGERGQSLVGGLLGGGKREKQRAHSPGKKKKGKGR